MQRSKASRIILYITGYFAFLAIGVLFLVLLVNAKQEEFNVVLLEREHATSTEVLASNLTHDYNRFLSHIESVNIANEEELVNYLNSDLENINSGYTKYFKFGLKRTNGLWFDSNTFANFNLGVLNEYYYNQKITVFLGSYLFDNHLPKYYLMFTKGNVVGLLDAQTYFNDYTKSYPRSTTGLITTKEQLIIYSRNIDIHAQTLDVLMGSVDGHNILTLSNNVTNAISYVNNNERFYTAATILNVINNDGEVLTNNIFAVHIYPYHNTFINSNDIFIIAMLFIIISIVLIIIAQLIIYRILAVKNADVETSRLLYYYQKPLILHVKHNGKIVGANKSLNLLVRNIKENKHINDLTLSDNLVSANNLSLLSKQISFDAHFKDLKREITIRFIPVKKINGYDLIGEDITNRDEHFQTYRSLALYHQTTGLPNLSYFKATINKKIESHDYPNQKHGIILLNISNFRNINRILGEQTADSVLIALSKLLLEETLPNMTLYNSFMDYFLIHFENISDPEKLVNWIKNMMIELEKPINFDLSKINLKLKVGIYYYEPSVEGIKNLNADVIYSRVMGALNQARNSDRDIVIYDDKIGQYVEDQKQMEKDLRKAIDNDEFVLYLQPQYNNKLEKIVSFEALIRWNNPKYIQVSPQVFISLAESNNLIIEIGYMVMKKTFELVKRLEKYNIKISMNISPVQVLQAGFINEFMNLYNQYDIKPNSVAIEITETFLMSSFDVVIDKLKVLKANGISIHLDDFGTGNSSLLYLKELPIDTIKIDRGFIMHLPQDTYSKAIINMIIALAKNLDLNVIAEGVETDAQNQFLSKAGCHVIQGWLISKALPVDDIINLLEKSENKANK